jgi:hypothetical protein
LYNIYSSVVVPTAITGIYYFKIYRQSTGAELLRSSYILVRNDVTELLNTTTYCKFRHDRFFYNIRYHDIPDFYQQFRLNLSVIDDQLESNKEVYREVTTGKQRVYNNELGRYYVVESYYFDPPAHLACGIMVEHDYLEMNGKTYKVKTSYKSPTQVNSKLGKGSFECYDLEFASANRC